MYNTEEQSLLSRFIENTDWILLAAVTLVVLAGLLGLMSATLHSGAAGKFIATQTVAILIGLGGLIIFSGFNYQFFRPMIWYVYGFSILLMIAVLVLGTKVRGTTGWFNFGIISFQPVEIAKLVFVMVLAGYLDKRAKDVRNPGIFITAMLILFSHWILIMLQPDFSSTLAYIPVMLVMLYISGVPVTYLAGVTLFGSIALGVPLLATFFKLQPLLIKKYAVIKFFVSASSGGLHALIALLGIVAIVFIVWWFLRKFRFDFPIMVPVIISLIFVSAGLSSYVVQKGLKEYQKKRLIVFLKPDIDPLGSGYNIIQSKLAIGSGRLFGRGIFSGKQTQLGFLPEQHTDFIFSVIGEETGYFISQILLFVYFIIVWRAMIIARDARDRFGSYIAVGLATMFGFYALINIGMTMGMMPATGLPLPLVSYGGSSMVASLWAIGILLSIHIRRFTN